MRSKVLRHIRVTTGKKGREINHRKNPIVYYLDLGSRVVWEKDLRFRVKQTRVLVFCLPIYIIFP